MLTLKLKDIKEAIAEDITSGEVPKNWRDFEKVGLSFGVYGMNGGLFRDTKTGKMYKITKRSTNLFFLA